MKLLLMKKSVIVHLKNRKYFKFTVSSTANCMNLRQFLKIGHRSHSFKDGFSSIVPKRKVIESMAELNNYNM